MTGRADSAVPLTRFLAPTYWGSWLVLALMWGIARLLPFSAQTALGRGLGRLLYRFAGRRRHIAAVNVGLCFPDLDAAARETLLKSHFDYLGMGMVEIGMAWWASPRLFRQRLRVVGREHLDAALKKGRGVILLSAHFCSLEVVGRLMCDELNFAVMYRDLKNPLFNEFSRRSRQRIYRAAISRDEPRRMLRCLKQGMPVWFAPDQNYGRRHSIFAPFFGIPASTIVATTRMAEFSQAAVVPAFYRRADSDQVYEIEFLPELENFPSGDVAADTTRINHIIETAIRHHPEQYFWVHRRFKTRPEGSPDLYGEEVSR
ncbi:MAG: LpxL/LpxP family Kdo(2)-lipid IV(A) lauroyl/palmitoleoyl acyltransferase [Gammaproteobacteria bacterium]|nr:LpxL/LpxP family Kdo(2)-lipid IV(A) lauroyl/palmitoleoyl acyltransferase [Gammaproteobacteria bacterium]